jgi:hypothetical protein
LLKEHVSRVQKEKAANNDRSPITSEGDSSDADNEEDAAAANNGMSPVTSEGDSSDEEGEDDATGPSSPTAQRVLHTIRAGEKTQEQRRRSEERRRREREKASSSSSSSSSEEEEPVDAAGVLPSVVFSIKFVPVKRWSTYGPWYRGTWEYQAKPRGPWIKDLWRSDGQPGEWSPLLEAYGDRHSASFTKATRSPNSAVALMQGCRQHPTSPSTAPDTIPQLASAVQRDEAAKAASPPHIHASTSGFCLPDAVTNAVGACHRHLVNAAFTTANKAIRSKDSTKTTSNVVSVSGGDFSDANAFLRAQCAAGGKTSLAHMAATMNTKGFPLRLMHPGTPIGMTSLTRLQWLIGSSEAHVFVDGEHALAINNGVITDNYTPLSAANDVRARMKAGEALSDIMKQALINGADAAMQVVVPGGPQAGAPPPPAPPRPSKKQRRSRGGQHKSRLLRLAILLRT